MSTVFVHHRTSPFNQRTPNKGPDTLAHRADFSHRQSSSPAPQGSTKPAATSRGGPRIPQRTIAGNSRIPGHLDIYQDAVQKAFQDKARGDLKAYNELLDQFTPTALENGRTSTHQLRQLLQALTTVTTQLTRSSATLVDTIISMQWYTMDDALVKNYKHFIRVLVSAKTEYLQRVLSRTVQSLSYQYGLRSTNTDGTPLTRRLMFDRLHSLLQSLFEIIPTLPATLQPLLVQHFPHKRQNRLTQLVYVRNLLRIVDYCPQVAEDVLSTIISRVIEIDVEIQIEVEELDMDDEHLDHAEVFALDPLDGLVGENDPKSDSDDDDENDNDDGLSDLSSEAENIDNPQADPERDMGHVQELVHKVDSLMRVLFDHFAATESRIAASTPGDEQDDMLELRRSQFFSLLTIFNNIVLRTFKSRYTQFLLFWYASLDNEFPDLFLGMLVERAVRDQSQPPVTRAAAASYIASFVSRATFVEREPARRVTEFFCNFLANHITGDDSPTQQHMVFYAVSQAVFLIFCFRWRDLLLEDEDSDGDEVGTAAPLGSRRRWLPALDIMHRVVVSPLNPLKACSPAVVGQFTRVAKHTGFMYCYPIIEGGSAGNAATDRAGPGSVAVAVGGAGMQPAPAATSATATASAISGVEELHSFFPFDPYQLPLSQSYMEGIYRDWTSVAIDDDEDSGDEEEDDDEEDEDKDEVGSLREEPEDETTVALGTSFGGMSISPQPARLAAAIGGLR